MWFRPQVQNLVEVSMINVRKDPEQLAVHVFYRGWEGRREFVPRLGGECLLIVEQVLAPSHYVVNVRRCWQVCTFAVLIYPCIAQPVSGLLHNWGRIRWT